MSEVTKRPRPTLAEVFAKALEVIEERGWVQKGQPGNLDVHHTQAKGVSICQAITIAEKKMGNAEESPYDFIMDNLLDGQTISSWNDQVEASGKAKGKEWHTTQRNRREVVDLLERATAKAGRS